MDYRDLMQQAAVHSHFAIPDVMKERMVMKSREAERALFMMGAQYILDQVFTKKENAA